MKFNKILTIAILAVCLVSIGFVGAVSATVSADFTLTAGTGADSLSATASASATGVNYTWTCADGTVISPGAQSTKITFTKAGTYEVTLKVTNSTDASDNATKKNSVNVTASKTSIDSVGVTLKAPKTGETAATTATVSGTGATGVDTASVTWSPADSTFKAETPYTATIVLTAKEDYQFADSVSVTLNTDAAVTKTPGSDKSTLTITKSFTATEAATVETPTPIVDTFNANVTTGKSPLTVEFTYTIKNMTSGDIYLMMGDTQLAETTYPANTKITYTFETDGTYKVTLKAINGSESGISDEETITVTDGGLISNVYLKVEAPSTGATPATSSQVTGDGVTCSKIEWATSTDFKNVLSSGDKFAADTTYYAKITLTNASGYHFGSTPPKVYINGKNYDDSVVTVTLPTETTLSLILKCFDKTSGDISSVSANVTAPATGKTPSESATLGASTYTASSVKWYKDGSTTAMNTTDKFVTNTKYKVTIVLESSGSNVFNSSLGITNAKINGNEPSEFKRDSNTKVTMSYLFPATVTPTGPGITFTMDPSSPKIPSTSNSIAVKYTYTITGDPTSSILDFGDGVQKDLGTQTSGSITHEYTMLGSYTATLTSTNADATTSKQLTFSVTKDSLIAKIEASPSSGTAPLKVTLKDASTGTISSRVWDFGDGSGSSTDSSVTHTYETPGTYTVTLTVSDGKDTSKAISAITVSKAAATESEEKAAVNYEPLMTLGDIEIPSPLDLIAEFIRLFQSMIDFDNYTIFSSSESEEE